MRIKSRLSSQLLLDSLFWTPDAVRTVVPRVEGKKPSEYEKRALFKFAIHPRRGQDIETSVDATIRSREASFSP